MFKNVFFNGQGMGYVSYFDWDSYSMISTQIPQFEKKTRDGPTDRWTDRWADGRNEGWMD